MDDPFLRVAVLVPSPAEEPIEPSPFVQRRRQPYAETGSGMATGAADSGFRFT